MPVELIDERWTTVEAERSLRELGHKKKKRKENVDAVAASILLRTYLEREQQSGASGRAAGEDRP